MGGQQSKGIRQPIGDVANALTSGDAADAMTPFDKNFADYGKLRDYFNGLAGAYQLVNEIEITGEEETEKTAKVTVHWTLTMTDPQSSLSDSREGDLTFTLAFEDGKWKISGFTPIDFFNPQGQKTGKQRSK